MKRLTVKNSAGYDLKSMNDEYCNNYCVKQNFETCKFCGIYKAFQKLGEYEDAEEQGTLIKSPCKLGDTVYLVKFRSKPKSVRVNGDIYTRYSREPEILEVEFKLKYYEDIDKTVFLTKEKAKDAIEKGLIEDIWMEQSFK